MLARKSGGLWSRIADVAAEATDPSTAIPDLASRVASVYDVELALADALAVEGIHPGARRGAAEG